MLASTVGIWGVALSTLLTDRRRALYVVPVLVAPAASLRVATFAWATFRPVLPGLAVAFVVFVGVARVTEPDTLLELLPLGVVWALACGWALWQFGLDPEERAGLGRELRPAGGAGTRARLGRAAGSGRGSRPRIAGRARPSRDPRPARFAAARELEPRRLVRAEVHDRVDELARRRHQDTRAGLAQVLGHLVVVGDRRHAEPDELADLGGLDPHVLRPRVERDVEVRRGRERLLAGDSPEENDVVPAVDALPDPLARLADEPEPAVREPRVDLVPELEQVVDVVERAVAAAVLGR